MISPSLSHSLNIYIYSVLQPQNWSCNCSTKMFLVGVIWYCYPRSQKQLLRDQRVKVPRPQSANMCLQSQTTPSGTIIIPKHVGVLETLFSIRPFRSKAMICISEPFHYPAPFFFTRHQRKNLTQKVQVPREKEVMM